MIGKSLIHYEITSQLGKGGMGEVYQAKDTKLGRDVAIKIMPEEFARDADRVARFQREAKLLASLNHPNIAAIYGLEESNGTNFLVMELIEGQTLADRIKTGSIPVEEALKLALQIAEALEAAHEKGVIHRDLKPANIKVTPDGKVKVLDFGLAKAFAENDGEEKPLDSPTLSDAATRQGIILGTAAYMSPEQAKGKSVDKRADIWAFGVVLFEMLTGRQLFIDETASETLASVMKSEPEWENLPPNLHSRIRFLLERCLKKEPRNRYSGISDARVEIQSVLADPGGVLVQPSLITKPKKRLRVGIITKPKKRLRVGIPLVAAIAILCLIVAGVAVWYLKPVEPKRVMRFDYHLPEDQQINFGQLWPGHTLAISSDGRKFIYSTPEGLFLRSDDQLEARLIGGNKEEPQSPFFSPDGQWVGYWSQADSKLKKISINGGAPVELCDVTAVYGAIWYTDNTIVYADYYGGGIKRVSSNGGTAETLVKGRVVSPQLLPGGKSILFTDITSQPYKIVLQSLETGERKELFTGYLAKYLPTGHLIYWLPSNIFAVPFDLEKLETTGGQVPVVQGAGNYYAISDFGNLVYIPERTSASGIATAAQRTLVWVDLKGNEEPLAAEPNAYQFCRISPDGTKVALGIGPAGNHDIYILDLDRGTMPKLTFDEADDYFPLWTPDGQRIVFYSGREKGDIYWKAANNTGGVDKLLTLSAQASYPFSWSHDGNTLVTQEISTSPLHIGIATLSMEGDRERHPLLQEKHNVFYPQVSPDGNWIAYQSDESGQIEVYVRPFPDVDRGGQWMVSNGGGNSPLWSPDGKELYYRKRETTLAVPFETEPTFSLGKPKTLFGGKYDSISLSAMDIQYTLWDIHPDGKRFLMVKPPTATTGKPSEEESTTTGPIKINIVLNWFEELKEKVPVD